MNTTNNKTKIEKVNTWLPVFSGFYGTIWETDNDEEMELDDINDKRRDLGLPDAEWDDVEWGYDEYHEGVAKGVTECVANKLEHLGMIAGYRFQELRSPREYNFHNDSVNVQFHLTDKNKKAIWTYLVKHWPEFRKYLKDRYTSYSGFISSYPNDAESWAAPGTLTHEHKLGSIFQFILANEDPSFEEEIYGQLTANGMRLFASNYEALTSAPKI